MGEVVEHAIFHIRKLIFGFLVANRATLRPFEVLGSHSTICFFLDFSVFCFTKVLRLRFQGSNIGGKERARNALSDTLENEFLVDNRATLRPFEGPRVPQHDLIFPTHICVANTYMSCQHI